MAESQTGAAEPRRILGRFSLWLCVVAAVTVLAGILFGYDQGVVSGALTFVKDDFDLSDTLVEVVTSWVTLGALFGALLAGTLADRFGRRAAGLVAGTLFVAGAITQSLTPDVTILVVGRFVIGLGVGVASVAAPLYAAELAPARVRGRFVSAYQLAITIGIFVAYVTDALLSSSENWRAMFGLAAVPGLALIAVMLIAPQSPRWLIQQGRTAAARAVYAKIHGEAHADEQVRRVADEVAHEEKAAWREIFARGTRKALWVGLGLALFQQVTGINAIIYYSDQIFDLAGFSSPTAQADATMFAVGGVNVLATFIAIAFVDKLGRRPLLFAGLTGMVVSLTALGLAFSFVDPDHQQRGASVLGILTMVCLIVYIASFAFSLGPVVWTVINEIFPNRVRGRAVALATAVNWASAFLVSQSFLTLVDGIGTSATFWSFAALAVVAMFWIARKVPETKGAELDDIQQLWAADDPVAAGRESQRDA